MLVLSRREKERIRLGDSIVVTVVRIAGDRVRLGIEAPANMLVLRDELEELPPQAHGEAKPGEQATLALEIESNVAAPIDATVLAQLPLIEKMAS